MNTFILIPSNTYRSYAGDNIHFTIICETFHSFFTFILVLIFASRSPAKFLIPSFTHSTIFFMYSAFRNYINGYAQRNSDVFLEHRVLIIFVYFWKHFVQIILLSKKLRFFSMSFSQRCLQICIWGLQTSGGRNSTSN